MAIYIYILLNGKMKISLLYIQSCDVTWMFLLILFHFSLKNKRKEMFPQQSVTVSSSLSSVSVHPNTNRVFYIQRDAGNFDNYGAKYVPIANQLLI